MLIRNSKLDRSKETMYTSGVKFSAHASDCILLIYWTEMRFMNCATGSEWRTLHFDCSIQS
jgi:hypothetical protein